MTASLNEASKKRKYLLIMTIPFWAGIVSLALIVFVDPYDVRSFGLEPRIAAHRYPDREAPLLRSILLQQPRDLVIIGGSTIMAVDESMMRDAFPDFRSPINLSYIAPRPLDQADALADVSGAIGLKKVILFMDYTLMEKQKILSASGTDIASLKSTNWHRAADYSIQRAAASFHRLAFGTYDLPSWAKLNQPEFMKGAAPVTMSASTMARFSRTASRNLTKAFEKSGLTCEQIPYIKTILIPFLMKMKARNVAVDLAFPPLPYVLYYDWMENVQSDQILLPGPVFDQFAVFKRCVVTALDRVNAPWDRVLTLDTQDDISGNMQRYMDSAHLLDPAAYKAVLVAIASGNEIITPTNIEEHISTLREKVIRLGQSLINQKLQHGSLGCSASALVARFFCN